MKGGRLKEKDGSICYFLERKKCTKFATSQTVVYLHIAVSESRIRDLWIGGIVAHGREYVFSQAGIESFRQARR